MLRLFAWSARASAPRPLTVVPSGSVMVGPSSATVSPAGPPAAATAAGAAANPAMLGFAEGKLAAAPTAREPTPVAAAH